MICSVLANDYPLQILLFETYSQPQASQVTLLELLLILDSRIFPFANILGSILFSFSQDQISLFPMLPHNIVFLLSSHHFFLSRIYPVSLANLKCHCFLSSFTNREKRFIDHLISYIHWLRAIISVWSGNENRNAIVSEYWEQERNKRRIISLEECSWMWPTENNRLYGSRTEGRRKRRGQRKVFDLKKEKDQRDRI